MFQNIKEGQAKGKHRGAGVFANVFSIQNIPLYIISFMTSIVGVGTGGQVSPFGISMMAACMGNSVPILGVVLAGILGNAIGFGLEGAITYLVISIVFVLSTFIIKPLFLLLNKLFFLLFFEIPLSTFIIKPLYQEEEKNEKIRLSKNIFIATLIVQFVKVGFSGFTVYDVLSIISFSVIAVVFYNKCR